MENTPISILIVDDSYEICDSLSDHFSNSKDLKVTGIAHDGKHAYSLFQRHKPDVVLLDLIMPFMDGFSFLEQVSEDNLQSQSKIIVISGISEEKFVNRALSLGADYFVMKPFDLPNLEKRIRSQLKSRVSTKGKSSKKTTEVKQIKQMQIDIPSAIARLLINTGIPVHTLGYKYFQCAISYLLEQSSDVFSITKTVYPYIAIKYETSSSCVDKAMRHCVNLAYQDNKEMLSKFLYQMNYRDSNAKPSNSEFLNLSLEKIKQDIASTSS